jgi:hypothetical protein
MCFCHISFLYNSYAERAPYERRLQGLAAEMMHAVTGSISLAPMQLTPCSKLTHPILALSTDICQSSGQCSAQIIGTIGTDCRHTSQLYFSGAVYKWLPENLAIWILGPILPKFAGSRASCAGNFFFVIFISAFELRLPIMAFLDSIFTWVFNHLVFAHIDCG